MTTDSRLSKVRVEPSLDGAALRIRLDAPKGNVLDSTMVAELGSALASASRDAHLRAVLLTAEGRHFSFGASVEEHRPASVAGMLRGFHTLLEQIVTYDIPVVAAVRGMCLGGGLELASACHRIVAAPDAQFAQPEIRLGVIAPAASALLPLRIAQGAADDLLLSGRTVSAADAHRVGLVDEVADDPEAAALAWVEANLSSLSASSLRLATRAARFRFTREFRAAIAAMESLYLDVLVPTADATEGIEAFLAKRPAQWSHR